MKSIVVHINSVEFIELQKRGYIFAGCIEENNQLARLEIAKYEEPVICHENCKVNMEGFRRLVDENSCHALKQNNEKSINIAGIEFPIANIIKLYKAGLNNNKAGLKIYLDNGHQFNITLDAEEADFYQIAYLHKN